MVTMLTAVLVVGGLAVIAGCSAMVWRIPPSNHGAHSSIRTNKAGRR